MIMPLNKKSGKYVDALAPRLKSAIEKSNSLPRLSAISEGPKAGTANVFIWDDIGSWWGVNKTDVLNALNEPGIDEINIYISSFGGEIAEALVIYDLLKGHPAKVTAYLTGFVCSAGTLVSCAADVVVCSLQCIYMIHRAQWYASGDADQLRKAAEILERIENRAVDIYVRKTGQDEEVIREYMAVEEWFEPEAALDFGFVDELVEAIPFNYEAISAGSSTNSFDDDWWWYFKADEVYTAQGMELIKRGYKPATLKASGNFSRLKNVDMPKLQNTFIKGIIAYLSGAGFIDSSKIADAENKLSEHEDLINEAEKSMMNSLIDERIKASLEDESINSGSTTLTEILENATDEEINALNERLENSDAGEGDNATDQTSEEIQDLQNKIKLMTDELAKLQGGTPGKNKKLPSNGPGLGGDGGNEKEDDLNLAQLQWMLSAFTKGSISMKQFETSTGMTPDEAKKRMAA